MKKLLSVVLTIVMIALVLFAFNMPTYATSGLNIRVRLSSMGLITTLAIKPSGTYNLPDGRTMSKNTDYTLSLSGTTFSLSTGGNVVYSTTDTYFKLTKMDTSKNGLIIKNTNSSYGTINYLGDFTFIRSGSSFYVINCLDFETYLYGVAPHEIGEHAGAEALKAQTIAARTYAIQKISSDQSATKYDILDTSANQVYMGYSAFTPNSDQSVNDTIGKVLMYNGSYASTNYTASNGGQTQSAADIFGGAGCPYLIVHDDEYDLRSTKASRDNVYFPNAITNSSADTTLDNRTLIAMQQEINLALYNAGYSLSNNDYTITGFKNVELFSNRYAEPSRVYNYAKVTAFVSAYKRDATKDSANVEYSRSISTAKVNLYQGPGTSYSIAGTIDPNSRLTILERLASGWVRVSNVAGLIGYCQSSMLVPSDLCASSTTKADGAVQENIELTFNVAIEDIRASFYANGKSLDFHTIWAVETTANGLTINFRGNGHAVGMSQEGAIVMSAEGKSYDQILSFYYPGTNISVASYAQNITPAPVATLIPGALYGTVKLSDVNSHLNVRETASTTAAVITTAPYGARLQILENNGTWLKIAISTGYIGYVMASYVVLDDAAIPTFSPPPTAAPTPDPTAVPTAAPTSAPQANTPTPIPATAAPTTQALYGKISTSSTSLNVRSGSGTKYSILGTAAKGSTVQILINNVTAGWHYITLTNGTKGYVSAAYITIISSATEPTVTPTPVNTTTSTQAGTVKITFSSLMIRTGPSTSYASIGSLTNGTQVTILSKSGSWYKIRTSAGKEGYSSASYIVVNSASTVSAATTKTVNGTVNVRKGAGTSYATIGVLYKGAKVSVLSTSGSWSKISYGSGTAYVYSSYLN